MTTQLANARQTDAVWPSDELESVPRCPVCERAERTTRFTDLTDRVFYCAPGRWSLHSCDNCGAAYMDPRPNPESIGRAYSVYYTHAEGAAAAGAGMSAKARIKRALYNGYLNARYGYRLKPSLFLGSILIPRSPLQKCYADIEVRHLTLPAGGGRVLDVGCGNGEFLVRMKSHGWDVYGVDFDRAAVESAARIGIEVRLGTLEQAGFEAGTFDAVTLNHLIEHVHDPVEALRQCWRVLKPGGTVWITTPNFQSWGRERYGANWRGLESPRHLTLFTPSSLRFAAERAGFQVTATYGAADSRFFYEQSTAISEGRDPYSYTPIPADVHAELLRQDLRALSDPEVSDIITVVGARPL